MQKKILFICGSMNQTTMMHRISGFLSRYDCYFTPYYSDGFVGFLAKRGWLDFTIMGRKRKDEALEYIKNNNLKLDDNGAHNDYSLVFTGSDLIIPKNIRNNRIILVQEGMTNPKKIGFYLVKYFNIPTWFGDTAATGLSDLYDYFCVASEGYRDMFIANGVHPEKIIVTGIPNYDNCQKYYNNSFPYKNFVLAATSDARETLAYENRQKFIERVVRIADGRQIIFKLHPNENMERAISEISKYAPPDAIIYRDGDVHEMIANCDVLITYFSTVVYTGIALGKEVYSYFDISDLKKMAPIQNGGSSAENIARFAEKLLNKDEHKRIKTRRIKRIFSQSLVRFKSIQAWSKFKKLKRKTGL